MLPLRLILCGLFVLLACPAVARPAGAHGTVHAAVERLTRDIEAAPDRADLLLQRGESYRIHGEYGHARADYDRAEALDPALPGLPICRAALALDEGEVARSRSILDAVLAARPGDGEALRLRAEARYALADLEGSIADLSRALEIDPDANPDPVLTLASRVASLGPDHVRRAIAVIDAGIQRLGEVPTLHFAAMEYELSRREFEAALLRLDRAAAGLPRRESVLLRRGEILLAAGRGLEAEAAFTEALELIEAVPPGRRNASLLDLQSRLRELLSASSPSSPQGEPEHASH